MGKGRMGNRGYDCEAGRSGAGCYFLFLTSCEQHDSTAFILRGGKVDWSVVIGVKRAD